MAFKVKPLGYHLRVLPISFLAESNPIQQTLFPEGCSSRLIQSSSSISKLSRKGDRNREDPVAKCFNPRKTQRPLRKPLQQTHLP
jgi:hypothetical protein